MITFYRNFEMFSGRDNQPRSTRSEAFKRQKIRPKRIFYLEITELGLYWKFMSSDLKVSSDSDETTDDSKQYSSDYKASDNQEEVAEIDLEQISLWNVAIGQGRDEI